MKATAKGDWGVICIEVQKAKSASLIERENALNYEVDSRARRLL